MKATCDKCHKVGDHQLKEWAWVRYKGTSGNKLVCPRCRREAEAKEGNVVSPARV